MTPARSLVVTLKILEPLSVQTPPLRPYGVLLAFSTASATVRNVCTATTGPKISSCTMRCDCEQLRNSVGRQKEPVLGTSQLVHHISAPSSWPSWRYSLIFSSCIFELIAPI